MAGTVGIVSRNEFGATMTFRQFESAYLEVEFLMPGIWYQSSFFM